MENKKMDNKMEELQEDVDIETAREYAQKLANHLRRNTVIIWQSAGKFMVYGRKEFMDSEPSNPRERQRIFETVRPTKKKAYTITQDENIRKLREALKEANRTLVLINPKNKRDILRSIDTQALIKKVLTETESQ